MVASHLFLATHGNMHRKSFARTFLACFCKPNLRECEKLDGLLAAIANPDRVNTAMIRSIVGTEKRMEVPRRKRSAAGMKRISDADNREQRREPELHSTVNEKSRMAVPQLKRVVTNIVMITIFVVFGLKSG